MGLAALSKAVDSKRGLNAFFFLQNGKLSFLTYRNTFMQ